MNTPPDIAWVDVETTGLNEHHDEIIEVAIIRTDWRLRELRRWHCLVMPSPEAIANVMEGPDAFVRDYVGLDPEKWRRGDARTWAASARAVAGQLTGCRLGGHVVHFDRKFLRAGFRAQGIEIDRVLATHHPLDTASLAYHLMLAERITPRYDHQSPEVRLRWVCEALGVTLSRAHEAMADIAATVECARRMLGCEPGTPPAQG